MYDKIDWEEPQALATDTDDQVVAKFKQSGSDRQALADAASGDLKELALSVSQNRARYRERYLSERRDAGGGRALYERAANAGFFDSTSFINSLVDEDPTAASDDRRLLSAQLAALCDDLLPLAPQPLTASDAPDGELLAVKLGAGEIHRFSTTGEDMGTLELPPEVQPPIREPTLNPDGNRLAFLAGPSPATLWTFDLDTGETTSSVAPTCMDWDEDDAWMWANVDTPPNQFIAHIQLDGTYDSSADLATDGCPSRFNSSTLAVTRPAVDGAPLQIELLPKDGTPAKALAASPCNQVNPRISPDSTRFLLTVGCSTDVSSGVYVVDVDGKNLRQVMSGVAAGASWSPDGRWMAFGAYSPESPGDTDSIRLIISTLDDSKMGAVTPAGYSWPIWISA